MFQRQSKSQRGVVLILVLGFISIVAMMMASSADNQRFLLRKTGYIIDASQARELAYLALDKVEQQLLLDARTSTIDHLNEFWAQPVPMVLPEATLWIETEDIGRFWNMNSIYSIKQGVSQTKLTLLEVALDSRGQDARVLGELIDWVDTNDEPTILGGGRERSGYVSAGKNYGPRNGFMRTRDELQLLPLWRLPFSADVDQWLQVSSACPDSAININTASRETLSILQPLLLSGRDIDFILSERELQPFESVNTALQRIVYTGDPAKVTPLLTVVSNCFLVTVRAQVNRTKVSLAAEFVRESSRMQEVYVAKVWQQWTQ